MKKSELEKMKHMGLGVSAGASAWSFSGSVSTDY
jgi:hypothetical protein